MTPIKFFLHAQQQTGCMDRPMGGFSVLGVVVLAAAAVGCAAVQHQPPEAENSRPPAQEALDAPRPNAWLDPLSSSVALVVSPQELPGHFGMVRAFRDLANALESLGTAYSWEPERLRYAAEQLELPASGPCSQTDLVKSGLTAGFQSLLERSPPASHRSDYQKAVEALGRSIDELDAKRPLKEQRRTVAAAFEAARNAVFLASGRQPPPGEVEAGVGPVPTSKSLETALKELRANVLKLGQTMWTDAREASARTLGSLADAVDSAGPEQKLGKTSLQIRFQAERLRRNVGLAFGYVGFIKEGLKAALGALDVSPLAHEEQLAPWLQAARKAVAGIDERESLSFQRAAVQDAFRTTADAFLRASEIAPPPATARR